jgi:hypothetical protein
MQSRQAAVAGYYFANRLSAELKKRIRLYSVSAANQLKARQRRMDAAEAARGNADSVQERNRALPHASQFLFHDQAQWKQCHVFSSCVRQPELLRCRGLQSGRRDALHRNTKPPSPRPSPHPMGRGRTIYASGSCWRHFVANPADGQYVPDKARHHGVHSLSEFPI